MDSRKTGDERRHWGERRNWEEKNVGQQRLTMRGMSGTRQHTHSAKIVQTDVHNLSKHVIVTGLVPLRDFHTVSAGQLAIVVHRVSGMAFQQCSRHLLCRQPDNPRDKGVSCPSDNHQAAQSLPPLRHSAHCRGKRLIWSQTVTHGQLSLLPQG